MLANFGKGNIWGKLMEDRGHFSQICLCRSILVPEPTFRLYHGHKTFQRQGIYGRSHFSEVYAFSQIREAEAGFFLYLLILNCL